MANVPRRGPGISVSARSPRRAGHGPRWSVAMQAALYGPNGFFTRPGPGPAGHFRTSANASPLFAAALARLLAEVDAALGRPDPVEVVDVGAGRGELLVALGDAAAAIDAAGATPSGLHRRLRRTAVELAPRP